MQDNSALAPKTRPSRAVILLTLNEETGLRALLPQLNRDWADEWLAVDGGSTDASRDLLSNAVIRVVGQTRRGRGEAFRIAAAETKSDFLLFFSPDGNEVPEDIPKLFQALEQGADMVIASRFLPDSTNEEDHDRLPFRKWANRFFTGTANALWNRGPWVTDTINGFRAIQRKAFERISPNSLGFTIEYEMTIHAFRHGLKIREIPTKEGQRLGGVTKAPSIKTGLYFMRFLAHELLFCRCMK